MTLPLVVKAPTDVAVRLSANALAAEIVLDVHDHEDTRPRERRQERC